jgi:hypothetical protein
MAIVTQRRSTSRTSAHGDDDQDQIAPIGASALGADKLVNGSRLQIYKRAGTSLVIDDEDGAVGAARFVSRQTSLDTQDARV